MKIGSFLFNTVFLTEGQQFQENFITEGKNAELSFHNNLMQQKTLKAISPINTILTTTIHYKAQQPWNSLACSN